MSYLLACAVGILHKMKRIFHIKNITFAILLTILSACSDGSSSSESGSGIGGTGISYLRGNIADVRENDSTNKARFKISGLNTLNILRKAVPAAYAQTSSLSGIVVSGGGQVTKTDESGNFVLNNITPSDNFILTIRLPTGESIVASIGEISPSVEVTLVNIVVDPVNNQISIGSKTQIAAEPLSDDVSNDNSSDANGNTNNSEELEEDTNDNNDSGNGAVGGAGPDSLL